MTANPLKKLVGEAGFEPATPCSRSSHLFNEINDIRQNLPLKRSMVSGDYRGVVAKISMK